MHAGVREVNLSADGFAVLRRLLEAVEEVEPDAGRIGAVGIVVGQRRGMAAHVPFLAVYGAGMAADADVEIDDEAQLPAGARGWQAGHVTRRLRCNLRVARPDCRGQIG